jgi:hypothetical protein
MSRVEESNSDGDGSEPPAGGTTDRSHRHGRRSTTAWQIRTSWKILALIASAPRTETEIAKALGATRNLVWRHVQAMREAGMPLEAVPDPAWNGKRRIWRISGVVPWRVD